MLGKRTIFRAIGNLRDHTGIVYLFAFCAMAYSVDKAA